LHPQQLGWALIELVIANGMDLEANQVHRLDRRLVVEKRRDEGRSADEVACGDDNRMAGAALRLAQVGRQEVGASDGLALPGTGGGKMSMEIIDRQDL
jgi:hypothetical protein